ncbi:MAG: hypothetical protein RBU37_27165, partial [Myxococcota bacterium]|nr:hypothetical protein [Myxococcota bacterium]
TNAARPTLLAANPGVEQSFVSLTPPSGPVDRFDLFYWSIGRQSEEGFEVLMPGVDARLSSRFVPGSYKVEGSTDSGEFCVYVFDPTGPPKRLAMNFYTVGIGMSGAELAEDRHWLETLELIEDKLAEHGITLDRQQLGYFSMSELEAAKYGTIRNYEDFDALLRLAQFPSQPSDDELLRLNVFLIDQFDIDGRSVLGLAPLWGIPGAHGCRKGGVAVAAGEMLGSGFFVLDESRPECFVWSPPDDCLLYRLGNRNLAMVIIHEAGHFFGLLHTSEFDGRTFDAFDDTPECHFAADPTYPCQDARNIMFPMVREEYDPSFSASQLDLIMRNPLVQP